jgi:hypothetical protein
LAPKGRYEAQFLITQPFQALVKARRRIPQKIGTMRVKPLSNVSEVLMIAKKVVKGRQNRGRAPFWLNGVGQARAPMEERALAVFQPDILVESQYQSTYRRRFHLEPERVLMLAVLQDAVVCFQDNVVATCKRKRSMHLEAEEWIVNEDRTYPFSFENVCEALGYEPTYMRQGLMRWKEAVLNNRGKKETRKFLVG